MKTAIRALVSYLIAVLVLSSIDITYEWLSSLPPGGESLTPSEWYDVVGLRSGAVFLANHAPPGAAGLSFDVRLPEFLPLPFLAGVGPEGGGILLSVWFIALLAWAAHIVWRGAVKRKSQRRHIAC